MHEKTREGQLKNDILTLPTKLVTSAEVDTVRFHFKIMVHGLLIAVNGFAVRFKNNFLKTSLLVFK